MRPTEIFDEAHFDLLSSGCGEMSKEPCAIIITHFEKQLLHNMEEEARFLLNGEKTLEPDDFVFHKEDFSKNHSATAPWLLKFVEFLKSSEGICVC